jgi:hypothetical protein
MPYTREAVWAPHAPKPNGKYSHVVKSKSGMVYLAGWMGDDPETGAIVSGGIEAQTVGAPYARTTTTAVKPRSFGVQRTGTHQISWEIGARHPKY